MGLTQRDRDAISGVYRQRLRDGVPPWEQSGWSSSECQKWRFILLMAGAAPQAGVSVLDVGCGDAAFSLWWATAFGSNIHYVGIDVCANIIARNKFRRDFVKAFDCAEIFDLHEKQRFDYIVCSGALNFRLPDGGNIRHARSVLERMWHHCGVMAACNFTSTWARAHYPKNYYYDPGEMFEFARSLCPNAVLTVDGHLPNEFTIQLWKG